MPCRPVVKRCVIVINRKPMNAILVYKTSIAFMMMVLMIMMLMMMIEKIAVAVPIH